MNEFAICAVILGMIFTAGMALLAIETIIDKIFK